MTRTRDLDYAPLTRSVGLGPRLKAAGTNNLMVMGGTVGVLLVIVPVVILIGLLATGPRSAGRTRPLLGPAGGRAGGRPC